MNIVYACNDSYARHLAVSMVSVFVQNQDLPRITVYVISIGLSKESKKRLRQIADRYGRELHFLRLDDIEERFDYAVSSWGSCCRRIQTGFFTWIVIQWRHGLSVNCGI